MGKLRRAPEMLIEKPSVRCVLTPLSWLYILGLKAYLLPYTLGLRRQHRLSCPVVCVGNLTFGGTGKTPVVISIAQELVGLGLKVVILSRGHGGRLSGRGAVVSDGSGRTLGAADCGDEPALIADSLPGVPVVIGKNRVRMGRMIEREFAPDMILMDDGMQYWQLHKDVVVALINAGAPFGTGGVLPAGTLREPASGLKRASAVIITGADMVTDAELDTIMNRVDRLSTGKPVFTARHVPVKLSRFGSGESLSLGYLQGKHVTALSSIGSPDSFYASLKALGANVTRRLAYPDHYEYEAGDLETIGAAAREASVVTTEKDAVRLDKTRAGDVFVLSVRMEIKGMEGLVSLIKAGCGL